MRAIFTLLSLFLFLYNVSGQEDKSMNFPEDFFGIYKGILHISSEKGMQDIPMEFHLLPTDSIGKYDFVLVYGVQDNRQERNYNLLEIDKEKGTYLVDENNGIFLDYKVVDNRMYTFFEVNNSLLTTFLRFDDDKMHFEIVFSDMNKKNITYTEDDNKTKVLSYPISTVQTAILFKQ